MRQFIDVTGKTEDEAISRALEQLGLDRDDVSVEILERAKAGFLGLGSCPAKVRVSYGPEEESASQQPRAEKVREERVEKPRAPRPEKKTVEKPAEKPQHREEPKQEPVQSVKTEELGEEVNDDRAQEIKKFLSGLLQQLEVQAEIKVYLPEKGRYKVFLEGQGLGAIIGRRGETLDAIQQLTSYSVKRTGSRVRIQLDAQNYGAKREQSLERLAPMESNAPERMRFSMARLLRSPPAIRVQKSRREVKGPSFRSRTTDWMKPRPMFFTAARPKRMPPSSTVKPS